MFRIDLDEDFSPMPGRSRYWTHLLDAVGELLAELVTPASDRLIADHHAALQQNLFDVPQAERKPEIPAYSTADDDSGKTTAMAKGFDCLH
jgi:hypothetical protein